MSAPRLVSIARGAAAALIGDRILWKPILAATARWLALPDGVFSADVVALDAEMPSVLMRDGSTFCFVASSGLWDLAGTLEEPPAPAAEKRREPRVLRQAAPEFGPAPKLFEMEALRTFGWAPGEDQVELGDTIHVDYGRARQLEYAGMARATHPAAIERHAADLERQKIREQQHRAGLR